MAKAPTKISDPSLRKIWQSAKDSAKKSAKSIDSRNRDKAKTHEKALATLTKTFRHDLGPNLEKWVKLYPDFPKMENLKKSKIDPAIDAYMRVTNKASIDPKIQSDLVSALKDLQKKHDERSETAKTLIESDSDLALKASKRTAKLPPPIVVFKHPDLMRPVQSEAGKLENIAVEQKFGVEIIISDPEILARFADDKEYVNQAQKIKDKGDFGKLVQDVAKALKDADKQVGQGKSLAAQEKAFRNAVQKACEDCRDRAIEEAARLGKLPGKARWANIKTAGSLVLAFAGAAAGVAGLAVTPFTFGVSTVAGCLGLAKASVEIGRQIADIASTAEMMANGIAKNLNTLNKQYKNWLADPSVSKTGGTSNKMGAAELGKRAVNSLAPTAITTLKSVKGDIGTYDQKIDNLEVKADKLGDNLSDWLKKQNESDKAFKEIQKLGRDALSDKETQLLTKILAAVDKTTKQVQTLIDSVTKLNARVSTNRKNSTGLDGQLAKLSVKNPLWSEVGSALFEATASVAFVLAGSVNAPDPYQHAKLTADIIGGLDTAVGQLQNTKDLAENLKDSFEENKKRVRA